MSSSIRRHHRQHTGTRLRRLHDAKIERIRRRHRADRTLTSMAAGRIAVGSVSASLGTAQSPMSRASASIGATTSSDTTTVTSSGTQTATGSVSSATGSVSSSTLPTETAISSGKALEGNGKNTTRSEENTTRSATESAADEADGTRGNAESSEGKPGDAVDWRKHPIRAWRAWYGRYKQTRFYQTWAKRPKFSYGAYVVIMFALIEIANMFLLWSVTPKLAYDPTAKTSLVMQVLDGTYHRLANTAGILNSNILRHTKTYKPFGQGCVSFIHFFCNFLPFIKKSNIAV